ERVLGVRSGTEVVPRGLGFRRRRLRGRAHFGNRVRFWRGIGLGLRRGGAGLVRSRNLVVRFVEAFARVVGGPLRFRAGGGGWVRTAAGRRIVDTRREQREDQETS